jgi:hypothetical protein
MRRLIVAAATLAVLVMPGTASAVCVTESFEEAVQTSDAVLVGTIVDARSLSHRIGPGAYAGRGGILVRIDVEEVLRGTLQDGEGFVIGGCLPPPVGPYGRKAARELVGTRGLFLITAPPDGRPSTVPKEAISPHLSLANQLVRAREVLGITRPSTDTFTAFPTALAALAGVLGIAVLVGGWFLVARRRPH